MSAQSQYVIGLYHDVNPTKNRCRHNIGCPLGVICYCIFMILISFYVVNLRTRFGETLGRISDPKNLDRGLRTSLQIQTQIPRQDIKILCGKFQICGRLSETQIFFLFYLFIFFFYSSFYVDSNFLITNLLIVL